MTVPRSRRFIHETISSGGFNNTKGTLAGTTAGTISYYEPIQQTGMKFFLAYLSGYENASGTAQTIAFPQAFTQSPQILQDGTAGSSVSASTLTLPISMGAAVTGWIVIVGF